jgi:hypothetical protein
MPRTSAMCCIRFASCGRYSLMRTSAARVAMSFTGPPLAWPGFGSHRSMVAGPPFIHSKMQLRVRAGLAAAARANGASQPLTHAVAAACK